MGAREEDFAFGGNCGPCMPAQFKPGYTPDPINICFRGIVKCGDQYDPPNGYRFKCEQDAFGCHWHLDRYIDEKNWVVDIYSYLYVYPDRWITSIVLFCDEPGGATAFSFTSEDTCQFGNGEKIPNDLSCAHGNNYEAGHATIWWQPDDIPIKVASDMGFHPIAGNMYDRLILPDNKQCIRIANRFNKTNILFLVDETQFT